MSSRKNSMIYSGEVCVDLEVTINFSEVDSETSLYVVQLSFLQRCATLNDKYTKLPSLFPDPTLSSHLGHFLSFFY